MTRITITTIEPPTQRTTIWCGKATSPRRTYEWFYDHDRQRFWTRSQRPGSGFSGEINRPPAELRAAAMNAIKQEEGR